MMELKYNRRQIRIGLVLGALLVLLQIANIVVYHSGVGFGMALGPLWLGVSLYKRYTPYAVVKDGYLKKDFGAKIPLEEITETKYFAGDYVFKSRDKKITISNNGVDKSSIANLQTLFNDLRDGKFLATDR